MKLFSAFVITMGFFLLFFVSSALSKSSCPPIAKWQQEINDIDRQIDELKEMKIGYEGRALQHQNQAERVQFYKHEQLTAKRNWILADENKKIAERIEDDIRQLEIKKESILKEAKSQ